MVYRGLRSFNEVYFGTGFKLWLKIAVHHIEKFDEFVKANRRGKNCNQAVGHQNLLVPPSMLDAEGIDYQVSSVGRCEAELTEPGQQHQIINYGYCAARSINYLNPDDVFNPKLATHCDHCGLQLQTEENDVLIDTTPLGAVPGKVVLTRKRKTRQHPKLGLSLGKLRQVTSISLGELV
ncbi:hypothetical protein NW762_005687 [Fusarium torreyae]|uniref:JmjC domain-containing protein n=1 Tax=Fusarium torreyae TaxID=1237075 RepID=A0A9W8VG47_9HYPO|nr:hypothetical protein NW762_005687 [Fusarium torreyae]